MNTPTKVYILGAGCSVCGEYPVASQVTARLLQFARERLTHDGAKELRRCTVETCARMNKLGVETIDQLAEHLNGENPDAIREAKLAMSAYFFSIEEGSVGRAFASYAAFFDEIFRYGNSPVLEDRAKATPCRVITYNYDRLLERTFIKWARRAERWNEDLASSPDTFVKKFLNTGIHDPHGISFQPNRLTFLKLHGGIGQSNRTGDGGMHHIYWPKFGTALPELNDESYFKRKGHETDLPTIVFPSDKKLKGRVPQANSFRVYMDTFEGQAKAFCRAAKEIQIIGYSIQMIDYFDFKALIAEAKNCKRIVLRNRTSEMPRLMRMLEGLKEEMEATWKIEFEAEDFFCFKPDNSKV